MKCSLPSQTPVFTHNVFGNQGFVSLETLFYNRRMDDLIACGGEGAPPIVYLV